MLSVSTAGLGVLTATLIAVTPSLASGDAVDASFFEGRWAFAEESCDQPTNWTFVEGGNFVSEDVTGSWQWTQGRLVLNLIDLAVDEETGEAGGRFQMEGPVEIAGNDHFSFIIEPDRYVLKRC
ncbi:hypothetical protein [Parasphingorhabdus sp.]|uniref:hypothetical protein n=1 Tax=Parasphingorhabdus sp. TaxID=2709688 RepID=UPI002F928EFE